MSNELEQAITFIKSGDRQTGAQLLAELLKADPENETAWLWMSSVVTTEEQQRHCLEQALIINPSNQMAKRGLVELIQREEADQPEPTIEAPQEPISAALEIEPEATLISSRLAGLQSEPGERPEPVERPPEPVSSPVEVEPPAPSSRLAKLRPKPKDRAEPVEPAPPAPSPELAEQQQQVVVKQPKPVKAPKKKARTTSKAKKSRSKAKSKAKAKSRVALPEGRLQLWLIGCVSVVLLVGLCVGLGAIVTTLFNF